jgi:hypothetical protein
VIAVLFARGDSVYKALPGCDVWDIERDARRWPGGTAVVAHPPCRAWGQLKHMAKPRPDEKELALWAVQKVRRFGGVLEHPKKSSLWPAAGLPAPGKGHDADGGWTLPVFQQWWGHRAEKATLLYIVGCDPLGLPPLPMCLGTASHVIASSTARQKRDHSMFRPEVSRPEVSRPEREHSPPQFAEWLVDLASRCKVTAPGGSRQPLENENASLAIC